MGSGTSSAHLTREECKQLVPEDKWDDSWDEFYFDDLKTVSREIAERVWAKSERWEAYVATGHGVWGILNGPATGEALAELIVDGAAATVDISPFATARLPVLDMSGLSVSN